MPDSHRSPEHTRLAHPGGAAWIVLIVLLAAVLRFWRIDHQSYWNDEGNSLALAAAPAGDILRAAAADIHPPGYYLLLKAWRGLAGETELGLRSLSALLGVVLAALLYRLGRTYFDQKAAAAAALLGAVNPFLIYYAQEARMYALLATVSAASFLLFSLWLRSSRPPGPAFGDWRLGLGYVAISAFGLYTHYGFGFTLIAQNLAALGGLLAHRRGRGPQRLLAWAALQAATLALFLPWLPTAYRQLTAWPAEREFHPWWLTLVDSFRQLAFGRTLPAGEAWPGLVAAGVLLVIGLRRGGQTITPFLWLLVPAGLTAAFGLLTESFSKILIVAAPALGLLLGNGLPTVRTRRPAQPPGTGRLRDWRLGDWRLGDWIFDIRHLPFVIGHLSFLLFTLLSLSNLYFNPAYFRDDYRGIARQLARLYRPGDAVITLAPNQVQAFGYYHRSGAEVFPLPRARPLDPEETRRSLEQIAAGHERIFVLYWGDEQADPDGVIESWLNANTFKAGDEWFGGVRLATYAAARPAESPAVPLQARFGEHIVLEGYTLGTEALAPGDIVQLTLFWRADARVEARYKVFVHLYAAVDQPPAAQHDGEPGGGQAPTSSWGPGERVADHQGVLIPADLPAGDYVLMAGLYNLFDGTRLPITLDGLTIGDRLQLAAIRVE